MKESEKSIYTIICPIENEPIYIGQAWYIKSRRLSHLNKKSAHQGKIKNRINQILDFGIEPIFLLIDDVPVNEVGFWEVFYIELFESWGFNLLNIQRKIKKK